MRLVALALGLAGASCADASSLFTGRWAAQTLVTSTWAFPTGLPELAIGHFGNEVAGVAWFLDENGLASGPESCRCSFVDGQTVKPAQGRLVVNTTFCDGAVWQWRLELDDSGDAPVLRGQVLATDGSGDSVDVELERIDTFIPEERKECP
ncbi:MAG: hypothetical protein H6745_18430 [Deltaproteobacteria bacterium]|nr:hypothetical protein [Deltaproteobacteria bacterium]